MNLNSYSPEAKVQTELQQASQVTTEKYLITFTITKVLMIGSLLSLVFVHIQSLTLWQLTCVLLLLSTSLTLQKAYFAAANQSRIANIFRKRELVFKLLTGSVFRLIRSVVIAILLAIVLVVRLPTLEVGELLLLALSVPIFWVIFRFISPTIKRQLKRKYQYDLGLWTTQIAACWISATILLLLYASYLYFFYQAQIPSSVDEYITQSTYAEFSSVLVKEISDINNILRGWEAFALGKLSSHWELHRTVAILWITIGNLVLFYGLSLLVCFCFSPNKEIPRALTPASQGKESQNPKNHPTLTRTKLMWMLLFIVSGAILLHSSLYRVETQLQTLPSEQRPSEQLKESAELIDRHLVELGTIKQIQNLEKIYAEKNQRNLAQLERNLETAFDRMRTNVDGFLDWYYSPSTFYIGTGKYLVGQLQEYVNEKFEEELLRDSVSLIFERSLNAFDAEQQNLYDEFRQKRAKIIGSREMDLLPIGFIKITESVNLDSELKAAIPNMVANNLEQYFNKRGSGALVGGVAGGMISNKISKNLAERVVKKVASKKLVKNIIVRTIGKAAAKKTISSTAATISGFLGSVIPGLGTAAGVVVGAATGFALADIVLGELDESLTRNKFREELLMLIDQEKQNLLSVLHKSISWTRK